jgi:ADP-ribose pyrophosphatase YjhB (NUDIX family)
MTTLYKINSAAKVVLVNPKNKILLYLRDNKKNLRYSGYWDFIGGRIEYGESAFETINREIKEELKNININGIEKMCEVYFRRENRFNSCNVHLFKGYFDCPIESIKLTEGQRLGLFSLEQIKDIRLPKKYKRTILETKEKWIR